MLVHVPCSYIIALLTSQLVTFSLSESGVMERSNVCMHHALQLLRGQAAGYADKPAGAGKAHSTYCHHIPHTCLFSGFIQHVCSLTVLLTLQQLECSPIAAWLWLFLQCPDHVVQLPSCLQMAPSNKAGGSGGGVQGGQPSPAKLLMQLVAAPSMFSLPLCTGRLLSPPFRV